MYKSEVILICLVLFKNTEVGTGDRGPKWFSVLFVNWTEDQTDGSILLKTKDWDLRSKKRTGYLHLPGFSFKWNKNVT